MIWPKTMDCEKFELAMLDELYGELDELTTAAAKRHVAGCARCSARIGGLRATRRVAAVPLAEPPADLEERILMAAERARDVTPPRARVAEAISLAGSWAMRPQTAMAAVFLVMIGTSVLLLRGKSARAPVSAEVTVTEQGTPAPAPSAVMVVARPEPAWTRALAINAPSVETKQAPAQATPVAKEAPPPTAGAGAPPTPMAPAARTHAESAPGGPAEEQPDDPFDAALRSYRAGHFKEAARAFDALSPADPNAPDLWAARSIRDGKGGCRAAVGRFDKTAQRYKQTPPGWDALLEGALCYRSLGELGTARARLSALLGVDSHKDRARAELERIDDLQLAQANGDGPAPGKAASKPRTGAPIPT
ncbi:MAG TPA: hypothetical protein VN894_17895, partial [Polyangiaceae bacterium]|nr:hypothetical protein [Polyangiaceae bacterium]